MVYWVTSYMVTNLLFRDHYHARPVFQITRMIQTPMDQPPGSFLCALLELSRRESQNPYTGLLPAGLPGTKDMAHAWHAAETLNLMQFRRWGHLRVWGLGCRV